MLSIRKLSQHFGAKPLYQDLDLEIASGECWGVLGLNGSGKSTLLHSLARLITPSAGSIYLDGTPLSQIPRRHLAQRIGILLQQPSDRFPLSVHETLSAAFHPHRGLWGWSWGEAGVAEQNRIAVLMEGFELTPLAQQPITLLSGGERQRLAMAALMLQNPDIALLDEPDNHLDPCRKTDLCQRLTAHFTHEGRTCLMSLHDPNLARQLCDHILLLRGDGSWQTGSTSEQLNRETLEALYGCPVLELQAEDQYWWLPGHQPK